MATQRELSISMGDYDDIPVNFFEDINQKHPMLENLRLKW